MEIKEKKELGNKMEDIDELENGSVYIKPTDVQKNKAVINGVEIEYLDKIYNNVRVGLSFMDRIKVLFGKNIKVSTTIYTNNNVEILGSESITEIEPINSDTTKLTVTNK